MRIPFTRIAVTLGAIVAFVLASGAGRQWG